MTTLKIVNIALRIRIGGLIMHLLLSRGHLWLLEIALMIRLRITLWRPHLPVLLLGRLRFHSGRGLLLIDVSTRWCSIPAGLITIRLLLIRTASIRLCSRWCHGLLLVHGRMWTTRWILISLLR